MGYLCFLALSLVKMKYTHSCTYTCAHVCTQTYMHTYDIFIIFVYVHMHVFIHTPILENMSSHWCLQLRFHPTVSSWPYNISYLHVSSASVRAPAPSVNTFTLVNPILHLKWFQNCSICIPTQKISDVFAVLPAPKSWEYLVKYCVHKLMRYFFSLHSMWLCYLFETHLDSFVSGCFHPSFLFFIF